MSRNHENLRVFQAADDLVTEVYRLTRVFPPEERYGLQAQIRRASVSVPTNVVEGCTRRSTRDYVHFLTMSLGSASEVRYLLGLARRLEYLPSEGGEHLERRYGELVRSLQKMINALEP
jgi:four helix bundle protein